MDDLTKEYVLSFYSRSLSRYGDASEAVKWSRPGQLLRFRSLIDFNEDINGKKVLDYGCGKGDFYGFLKEKKIDVEYTGFDINEDMISLARSKFPGRRFEVFDIEQQVLDESFDYIFLCGVFNLKVSGIYGTVRNVLSRLFGHCRSALVFNALSSHEPRKSFELNYINQERLIEFVRSELSPDVSLRYNRSLHDFNLLVYKTGNNYKS